MMCDVSDNAVNENQIQDNVNKLEQTHQIRMKLENQNQENEQKKQFTNENLNMKEEMRKKREQKADRPCR